MPDINAMKAGFVSAEEMKAIPLPHKAELFSRFEAAEDEHAISSSDENLQILLESKGTSEVAIRKLAQSAERKAP